MKHHYSFTTDLKLLQICKSFFLYRLALLVKISIFLVLLFFGIQSQGQIKEAEAYLASITQDEKDDRLIKLTEELQPSVFFYADDHEAKTIGDSPTCLFTDYSSLSKLRTVINKPQTIELISIQVQKSSELNRKVDLNVFSFFPNLKYIYITTTFQGFENNIKSLFSNDNGKYTLLYLIGEGN